MGVLGLQERVRSRLFLRRDKYSRFISALVYLPRERFNTDVRLRIEAMLRTRCTASSSTARWCWANRRWRRCT